MIRKQYSRITLPVYFGMKEGSYGRLVSISLRDESHIP